MLQSVRRIILGSFFVATLAQAGGSRDLVGKPPWAAEAIFYQIFPERFRNGDPSNDPTRSSLDKPVQAGPSWKISAWTADWYARDDWEKELGTDFYKDGVFERRYGGDLQGVLDKLDYLTTLGVNALYFNPLFYSPSLHKYDGSSFHHIDPYFGPDPQGDIVKIEKETSDPQSWTWTAADQLFLELIKQCHSRGIHVIIDGVFNHTGREFFAFKDLRQKQERSSYKDWYVVNSFDNPATKRNEFSYKGWWGHASLPVFAASGDRMDMHPGPKAYIFQATKRWMTPHGKAADGIDGWRLDVADERPAKFWADWNAYVRQLNPTAYTTAEIWKDASELITKGGFSASMNYNAFAIPVKGFLCDNQVPPSKFARMLNERRHAFPAPVAAVMQNLMDSHDTDRLASMIVNGESSTYRNPDQIEFNDNDDARSSASYLIRKPNDRERSIQRLVVLFQMTYIGAPMIYYGDEAGMWGGHDPDDRMPMIWQDLTYEAQGIDPRGNARESDEVKFDDELFAYYQHVIALRRGSEALNHGEFEILSTDDVQRTIAFSRRSSNEAMLVLLNRGNQRADFDLHVAANKMKAVFVTQGDLDAISAQGSDEGARVTLPALTGAVFTYK